MLQPKLITGLKYPTLREADELIRLFKKSKFPSGRTVQFLTALENRI
jgi:hypothetical protein